MANESTPNSIPNTAPAIDASNADATQAQQSNVAPTGDAGKLTNPVAPGDQSRQPKPPVQPPRKMKLKVDGRNEELSEEEVIKWAQMGRAAQSRFQEAAAMRKQAEDFIQMLKTNPRAVLENKNIGVDLRKFAEDYLGEQLRAQQMTPEQRRIKELEDSLKAKEAQEAEGKKTAEQRQHDAEIAQYQQEYDISIPQAIEKAGLPKTPYTVKRITDYMISALNNGVDVSPDAVTEMVRQDYMSDLIALAGGMDGDRLLALFGDGVSNKIRKADLARLKKGLAGQGGAEPQLEPTEDETPSQPAQPSKAKSTPKKPESLFEFRARMDKMRNS